MAPTLRSWVVASTIGTSLALLFDGERGARRREMLMGRGRVFYGMVNQRLNKRTQMASDKVYGDAMGRVNMYQPDNPNPDDNTLRDRIEK